MPHKSLESRVAELEFLFTHLERQAADLSRVALEQQRRIEVLETQQRALQRVSRATTNPPTDLDEP